MKYRNLGNSGLRLSELSFGSWVTFNHQVDTRLAERMFAICFDSGINFFDNAEAYEAGESEIVMGKALRKLNKPRDSYCVSSKVMFGRIPNFGALPTQKGLSKKHVTEACHQAMERLQVDYLDLYFCHRPDPRTPIEETVWAMHNLITQGKVLYWGTSEWSAEQIKEAYDFAHENHLSPPTMEQPQYNMLDRKKFEIEYNSLYKEYGLGTTIWSPLASGVLTGKYLNENSKGIYNCVCCDNELFSSDTKFDSTSGWPSFYDVINNENISHIQDSSPGMHRIAVLCSKCDAHLGHVFDDGPQPTGQRYCMNSLSLKLLKSE